MKETLWIIDHYSSEPKYGGYTRQYNLARGIADYNINVVVISSSFSHFRHTFFTEKELFFSDVNSNVHYAYLKTDAYASNSGISRFKSMISFKRKIRRYSDAIVEKYGKPTWIVASSPHIFDWVAGEEEAKKYGVDFSIEIRDFWPLELRSEEDSILKKILYGYFDRLETHSFKKARHIIGTMPYGNEYFEDFKKPGADKFVFIGQPLDCEKYNKLAKANWELVPNDIKEFVGDSFFCVFAGYYMKYEGVYQMLEAANELRDVKFVFVGSGNEKQEMQKYVASNDMKNVYIGDRIDKETIPSLISKSAVCLAYLHDENNPQMFKYGLSKNKINEYMYSGAVTIMGFDYDNNEIRESNGGYTFYPRNNEFAKYIRIIREMTKEDRAVLGKNSREYIEKEHNIQSLAKKYVQEILER